MQKLTRKIKWQDCCESEIAFFETCFDDGDERITMLGVPEHLKTAYEDYYAWRTTNDDGSAEILDDY